MSDESLITLGPITVDTSLFNSNLQKCMTSLADCRMCRLATVRRTVANITTHPTLKDLVVLALALRTEYQLSQLNATK